MSAKAHINPAILRWMRERRGLSLADAEGSIGYSAEQLSAWEEGRLQPTFIQAQKLAKALYAPFGYLFLAEAPIEDLPLPDLRTLGGAQVPRPSVDLLDTIRACLLRQDWYVEYLQQDGSAPLPFVGRFSLNAEVKAVAADIRAVLGDEIDATKFKRDTYYNQLILAAEQAGILVMRSGMVGNNTRRVLDVGEFRGFAVSHPYAPLVFINSADAMSARLFTLLHELAHIWVGSSGISNASPGSTRREEIFCNAVAGEFLAPSEAFWALWNGSALEVRLRVAEIANHFHVSNLVIMRRALDLGLVDQVAYWEHYQAELAAFRSRSSGGGSFYRTAPSKTSKRFARAVLAEAFSGRLLLRDAGRLLGVQPDKLRVFAGEVNK